MRIEQLMYLVEISKHRSMNKASERLFLSPQALSLSMKSLEENLGIQLLVRTPQGITFTEAGKRLVEISEIFLNELSEIQKDSKIINLFGDVELYTPEPLLENFFAKPLGKFYKDYPNLDIHIKSFEYEKMIEFLCKKQLPYCFWYQCYIDKVNIIQDIPEMYSFIPMMEVKFFCCASKEHRFLKKCKNISLYELRDETVIIHTPSKYILDKILDYAQISPKNNWCSECDFDE